MDKKVNECDLKKKKIKVGTLCITKWNNKQTKKKLINSFVYNLVWAYKNAIHITKINDDLPLN